MCIFLSCVGYHNCTRITGKSQYRNWRYCKILWVMKMYQRIRDLREDADLTQKKIAKILNCSQQSYSDYETGTGNVPTDMIVRIAKLHKTTTDYVLGLTNERDIPWKDWPLQ